MKHSTKTLLCVLCAAAAALCVIFAIVTLTQKQSASSASSAAASSSAASSAPAVSEYGTVDSFDYQNFTYSDGLDANGYRTGITAQDYVTLPDNVAALPIKKADVTPSDSDVQARIDSLLSQYSTTQAVTDRAAQNGDVVNIDYSGTVDGVAFNGGTYQGYDLTLGSGSFITSFEDQIVGHNTGDTFDVTVTFPDGYDATTDADGNTVELSGKEAVFRVTVNSISEPVTPELTDEWVDSTFGTGDDVHTVEALRTYFSDALYDQNLEDAIMDSLLDNAAFKDLPSEVPGYYACMFLNYYYQLASYYSSDLDTIAQAQGYTDANAMLGASDSVITHLAKQDLLYQAIAESQGIEPTQEQLAHTLTVLRRRMKAQGQLVAAVEPNLGGAPLQLRTVQTADGARWWYAFTSFEQELKGAEAVQSTFLVEIEKLFDAALTVPEISGVILNPWDRTLQLDKNLIRIIKG